MRIFHYTYRDKNGETKQGELKATNRADVLRELNLQGHIPLSVKETTGLRAGGGVNRWMPSKNILLVLGALVIVLILGLLWNPFTKQQGKPSRSQMAKSMPKRTDVLKQTKAVSTPVATQQVVAVETTNQVEQIAKRTPSVADVIAMSADTNQVGKLRPSPAFNMAAESVMSMLLKGSPAMPGPPIPRISNIEKRFMDSLTNNIILYDTDSEDMAKQKEQVALLKLEFAEYMKQGYTASNIVTAIQEQRAENAKLRRDLRSQMMELYNAGQIEAAEKYRDESNAYLAEKGLPVINLPKPKQ